MHEGCYEIKRSIEQPEITVDVQLNEEKRRRIEENRCIVKSAAEALLSCGRQCIALRGHSENLIEARNPGNFLAMLEGPGSAVSVSESSSQQSQDAERHVFVRAEAE